MKVTDIGRVGKLADELAKLRRLRGTLLDTGIVTITLPPPPSVHTFPTSGQSFDVSMSLVRDSIDKTLGVRICEIVAVLKALGVEDEESGEG